MADLSQSEIRDDLQKLFNNNEFIDDEIIEIKDSDDEIQPSISPDLNLNIDSKEKENTKLRSVKSKYNVYFKYKKRCLENNNDLEKTADCSVNKTKTKTIKIRKINFYKMIKERKLCSRCNQSLNDATPEEEKKIVILSNELIPANKKDQSGF